MATVGHIKAEVLLKIDGMEGTYSVGHLEIPVNISTDEKRPAHVSVRADTSETARSLVRGVEGVTLKLDSRQIIGALGNHKNRKTRGA